MPEYPRTTNHLPTLLEPVMFFRISAFALTGIAAVGLLMGMVGQAYALSYGNRLVNFTWAHDLTHLVLAAAAVLFGFATLPGPTVRLFAIIFGCFYLVFGIAGFAVWSDPASSGYAFLALTPALNGLHVALGAYAILCGALARFDPTPAT